MKTAAKTIDRLKREIRDRLGVVPSFFTSAEDSPEIMENLWRQAEFAYLDNPLPALFKEKLFTYLSRFCRVPYCMARHLAFLLGRGNVAGDPTGETISSQEALTMLARPLPNADEIHRRLNVLVGNRNAQDRWSANSEFEASLIVCSVPLFLHDRPGTATLVETVTAERCQTALQRVLSSQAYQYLVTLLSFIRTAHYWTETHPNIELDEDVNRLLDEEQSLADWIRSCPAIVSDEIATAVDDELARLQANNVQLESDLEQREQTLAEQLDSLAESQKRAAERDQQWRESEQRFRQLANNIDQVFYLTEIETHQLIYISPACETILGIPPEWHYDNPGGWMEFVHPDDRDRVMAEYTEQLATGFYDSEYRVVRADGSARWIQDHGFGVHDDEGRLYRIAGVLTDISERKWVEEEVRKNEIQLRLITDSVPTLISYVDLDQRYQFINAASERKFGLSREAVVGRTVRDVIGDEFYCRAKPYIEAALRGEPQQFEYAWTENGGKRVHGLIDFVPHEDGAGRMRGVYGLISDVTSLKDAEQAVRESECRYRVLFDDSPLFLWEEDWSATKQFLDDLRDAGCDDFTAYFNEHPDAVAECLSRVKLTETNKASIRLFEAKDKNDLLASLPDLIAPESHHVFAGQLAALADGQTKYTGEVSIQTLTGKKKSVLFFFQALLGSEQTLKNVVVSLVDINDLRNAEQRLIESENRLRTIFAQEPECVKLVDRDGELIDMNPAGLAMIEADSLEQVAGQCLYPVISESHRDAFESLNRAVFAGETRQLEFEIQGFKGTRRWMDTHASPLRDAEGKIIAQLAVTRDITERKKSEQALRESEEKFAAAFRSSPTPMSINSMDGRFVEVNQALCDAIKYSPDELIGRTSIELGMLSAGESGNMRSQVERGSGAVRHVEIRVRIGDGNFRDFIHSVEEILLQGVPHYLVTSVDVTERKQAEQELRANEKRLALLSRQLISAQETERRYLARELHDEIGQTLSNVAINLKLLRQDANPTVIDRADKCIEIVDAAVEQVRNLSLDLRPAMLDDFGLKSALTWYAQRLNDQTPIKVHFQSFIENPHELPYDVKNAVFRVAQEALTNVLRHAQAQDVWLEMHQKEDFQLIVRDNGCGFDVEAARRRARHGESLGLLGMQERVELIGGQVEIRSELGKGTEVSAYFSAERLQQSAQGQST